jgi:outer membrane beta-barrel protein
MNALAIAMLLAMPAQTEGGMDFGAEPPPADAPPPSDEKSSLDEAIDLTLQDRIKAVHRKVFLKEGRFELQPAIAATTNDPFFRTWSISGRGAYHLNDAFSLELGAAIVPPYFVEELPALAVLSEKAGLINFEPKLLGIADAGVTFSPVYGKLAILSDAIIHFDTFVAAGGGAVFDAAAIVHPTMDVGVGARVFLLRWLVVRSDLRDYVYPQDRSGISTLQNLLVFSLGVGFYFPLDFEYRYEAAKVKS